MKVLYLTLKKRWFDMIASGEKKEEYREIKPYWEKKLEGHYVEFDEALEFDVVRFARGGHFKDTLPQITVECLGIHRGTGKTEWGAEPGKEYFVIKLGKIIQP